MAEVEIKDVKKLQTTICCLTKKKFEAQLKDTGMTEASLLKFIMSEYYSKVNLDYNR